MKDFRLIPILLMFLIGSCGRDEGKDKDSDCNCKLIAVCQWIVDEKEDRKFILTYSELEGDAKFYSEYHANGQSQLYSLEPKPVKKEDNKTFYANALWDMVISNDTKKAKIKFLPTNEQRDVLCD